MFKKAHTRWSMDSRTKGARAERLNNLVKMISTLAEDLSIQGDLEGSVRFYTVTGDPQDPEARFTGAIPRQYPLIQSLQAAHDGENSVVDDSTLGLVLAGSAWRHLTFQEYVDRDPQMIEKILARTKAAMNNEKAEKMLDKKAAALMQQYYESQIVPGLPNPRQMPENMRIETMVLSVVMRDRFSFVLQYDEGGFKIQPLDDKAIAHNHDMNPLWQFLHGLRPEQITDPFQAVKDVETLKALSESLKSDG